MPWTEAPRRDTNLAVLIPVGIVSGVLTHFFLHRTGAPPGAILTAGLATIVAMAIGCPIGLLVGHLISHDSDVDTNGFRIVAWLSLVAWLMPVAGFAFCAMVWLFSRRSQDHRTLYYWLYTISGVLAFANAAAPPLLQYSGPLFPSTVRSTERCPYAARENWSMSDVKTYCFPPSASTAGRAAS